MILTYQDIVDHLLDYLGSDPGEAALRDAKKAVQEAYRDLANAHRWTYLFTTGQMNLNAPVTGSASLTYLQSSGVQPRVAVLSSGTWPTWASDGLLVINNNSYRGFRLIDSVTLQLEELNNPGADITTPSDFAIYCDTYPLPSDFISQDVTLIPGNFGGMEYIHPRDWIRTNDIMMMPNRPFHYTITGLAKYPGRFLLNVAPMPDVAYQIHFAYKRRPRPLVTYCENTGFMTTQGGVNIVGSANAAFSQGDIGAVIRLGFDSKTPPTNETGNNPAFHESYILAVTDATHAVLDTPAPVDVSGVTYTISDPIDIDQGSMESALLRLAERKLSIIRIMKDRSFPLSAYQEALEFAKCADSRTTAPRSEHPGPVIPIRRVVVDLPSTQSDPAW